MPRSSRRRTGTSSSRRRFGPRGPQPRVRRSQMPCGPSSRASVSVTAISASRSASAILARRASTRSFLIGRSRSAVRASRVDGLGGELSRIALALRAVADAGRRADDRLRRDRCRHRRPTAHAVAESLGRLGTSPRSSSSRICRNSRAGRRAISEWRRSPATRRTRASRCWTKPSAQQSSSECSAAREFLAEAMRHSRATNAESPRDRVSTATARLDRRTKRLVRASGPRTSRSSTTQGSIGSPQRSSSSQVFGSSSTCPRRSAGAIRTPARSSSSAAVCAHRRPGRPALRADAARVSGLSVRGASSFGTAPRRRRARVDEDELEQLVDEQQGRMTEALEAFADNTMRYLREEGRAPRRGNRLPAAGDALPRAACARGRPRAGLQAGPRDRARVHPRLQARARRGRRRSGRAARGRLPARRHRRRHGLGLGRGAPQRRRARRARLPRTAQAPGRARLDRSGSPRRRPDARHQRGPARCCSRTRRAPSSSSRSGRISTWSSSSSATAQACRRRS